MKKVIISLLLVLPFLLIYFISFTGQILSKYTYIPVEKIVLLDENGDELKDNTITCKQGEKYQMRIKVLPEFATNKKFSIASSNKEACPIDEDYQIIAQELGESTIIITSNDKHNVQYVLRFKVAQEELEDIDIMLDGTTLVDNQQINLAINKSKNLSIKIIPNTTALNYRGVKWSSSNSEYVKVTQNGTITALKETTTPIVITAISTHNEQIKATLLVSVTLDLEKGIYFVAEGLKAGQVFPVPLGAFDLKTITKIVDLPEHITITYKIIMNEGSSGIDSSKISEGIVSFLKINTAIKVRVTATDGTNTYYDTISLIGR